MSESDAPQSPTTLIDKTDETYVGDLRDVDGAMNSRVLRWALKMSLGGAARTFGRLTRWDFEEGANPRTTRGVPFITLWFSAFVNAAVAYVTAPEAGNDKEAYDKLQREFLEKNRLAFTMMTVVAREMMVERRRFRSEIAALRSAAAAAGVAIEATAVDGYPSSDDEDTQQLFRERACGGEDFLRDGFSDVTAQERAEVLERVRAYARAAAEAAREDDEKHEDGGENAEPGSEEAEEAEVDEKLLEERLAAMEVSEEMPEEPPVLRRETRRRLDFDEDGER